MLKAIKRAKICMHACCNSMCDQNTRQHLRWISAVQHCKEFRIFINYKSYRTTESLNWKNHLVQLTTYHPLNCVLRCSTSLFLEYFQGCWPHHLPGQPAPMYHHCTQPEPGVPWGHQALILSLLPGRRGWPHLAPISSQRAIFMGAKPFVVRTDSQRDWVWGHEELQWKSLGVPWGWLAAWWPTHCICLFMWLLGHSYCFSYMN